VVLYGCETWSLTLRKEHRLRVFENRVLRRVFGPKRDEVTGNGENYITRSFVMCAPRPVVQCDKGCSDCCSTAWDRRDTQTHRLMGGIYEVRC
jgi:hypothetical protein